MSRSVAPGLTVWPARELVAPVAGPSAVFRQNLPFVAGLAAFVAAVLIFTGDSLRDPTTLVGMALVVAAFVGALVLPWPRWPARATMSVPVLDLLALGVMASGGLRISVLGVLPVMTLSRAHGVLGASVGVVMGTGVSWAGQVALWEPVSQTDLPRLLLVPIVLVSVAGAVIGLERASRARTQLLRNQDDMVRTLLDEQTLERTLLEKVLASLPAGVLVLDDSGRAVMQNSQFERLIGTAPGGATGSAADLIATLLDLAGTERTVSVPTRWLPTPGGGRRAVRSTVVQVGSRGRPGSHRVLLFEDLTHEEESVAQRDDFVAAVSHELRNPLTSVIASLDLLREQDLPAGTGELVEVSERNTLRVLRLVEDLLAASSLQRGAFSVQAEPVDLRDVVRESLEAVSVQARAARIAIEDRTAGVWTVSGDRVRLVQVLVNLLDNSISYSRPGGHVVVQLGRTGDRVSLSVTDDGIGMSEEDRLRVFERFFRAPSMLRTSRHGTGLGLHVSREIVLRHGGEIHVHSELGTGTRVEVLLPLRMRAEPAA